MSQSRQSGFGPLAQTVEHRHHTPRVAGSIPARSTMRSSKQAEYRVEIRGLRVRVPSQSATLFACDNGEERSLGVDRPGGVLDLLSSGV